MSKRIWSLSLIFENVMSKLLDNTAMTLRLPQFQRRLPIQPQRAEEIFRRFDPELIQRFTVLSGEVRERYEYLFRYLLTGFMLYRGKSPSLVQYNGIPSWYDARAQAMEGFTRFLPLICAWLTGGRSAKVALLTGEVVDLEEIVREGVIDGTNPASPGYWGDMTDYDQRIVEAGHLALSIRMLRDSLWKKFTPEQQKQIVDYMLQANGKKIVDNNWNMFPVWINKVAASLGFVSDERLVEIHFGKVKSFYRGKGWFTDGMPKGKDIFDYYNIFGFHFFLFWLTVFEPEFEREFIQGAMGPFLENYLYLLTPAGVPLPGPQYPLSHGAERPPGVGLPA